MGSPAVLDIEELLKPIAEGSPTGANLREDFSPTSPYQTLKDARNKARRLERENVGDGELPPADWKPILNNVPQILKEKAKDLEITVWYIEALVRSHQIPGLRDGFKLAKEMVVRFWDNLHPMPDAEDGLLKRTAPFTGLNGEDGDGTLINPINNIRLTQGKNAGPFTRASFRQAADLDSVTDPDKRRARVERGAVSMDKFLQAVAR